MYVIVYVYLYVNSGQIFGENNILKIKNRLFSFKEVNIFDKFDGFINYRM